MKEWFAKFATRTSAAAGSYLAFVFAAAIVLVWAVSGPLFKFSTTWQLVINTGTTIVTFLMVFLIQNSQNRDSRALQLKLDELLRAVSEASNRLIDVEEGSEEDLTRLREEYKNMRDQDSAQAPQLGALIEEKVESAAQTKIDEQVARHVSDHVDEHHAGESPQGQRTPPAADAA